MSWPTAIAGGAVGGAIVSLFGLTRDGTVVTIPTSMYAMESYPDHEVSVQVVGVTETRISLLEVELGRKVLAMIVYNLSAVNTAYWRLGTAATVANGVPVYPRDYSFVPVQARGFLSLIADAAATDVRVVLLEGPA